MASSTPGIDGAAIDAIVQEAMETWKVPGASLAVVRGDEVAHLKGYGVREQGSDQPVTPETLFAIGSTTKAFVTTGIAMMVEAGKMAWDDPVRKHLEFFRLADPLADANVTLRDLAAHRTGLARHDMLWYGSPWGREEVLRRIGRVKLENSFRSKWGYQNIMYLAAGCALGAAAGATWEEFTRERILEPLGMTGANFSTTDAEKAADHATPHRKKEERIEVIPWRNLDNIAPAGAINAGVRDMSRWLRFQLGGGTFEGRRLLGAEVLAETRQAQMSLRIDEPGRRMAPETHLISYGLGWQLQDYRGQWIVSHGGGIDGFRAGVAMVPDAGLGWVVLSNLGGTPFPEAIANSLVDLLLDLPRRDWNSYLIEQGRKSEEEAKTREREQEEKRQQDTRPARDLAAYAGSYEEPAYGTVSISLENGALALQWSSFHSRLEHWHYDTFVARNENPIEKQQIVFSLGSDGDVARMSFLGQEFQRVKPKPEAVAGAASPRGYGLTRRHSQ
jgi:CubicO group peptidase (beta-lactamase class C family)